jgi:hypothetical protein
MPIITPSQIGSTPSLISAGALLVVHLERRA